VQAQLLDDFLVELQEGNVCEIRNIHRAGTDPVWRPFASYV
jgi:hypothetical protein